jgi:hypothetical protein
MTPVHAGRRRLCAVIAAQAVIGGDLVGAQQVAHRQVIFEMCVAKLAFQPANVGQDTMQARVIDAAAREGPVELPPLSPGPGCQAARTVFRITSNNACVRPR